MADLTIDPVTEQHEGDTLSERAALLLQRDILTGILEPSSRLAVVDLARRYGIGATPIREGLSRLVARGLIVAIGQRGFRVAQISSNDLEDITRLRVLIEREALRISIEEGGDDWEAAIVASLHRLRRQVEKQGAGVAEGADAFDALHKAFHATLISACGSPRMLEAASNLYDQAYRYRRVMMREKLADPERFVADHARLADCVLARDHAAAAAMLEEHLRSTMATVYPERE